MDVRLFVMNEKANARELRLGPETLIGRSRDCHLRIASNQVSRKHCLITIDGREVLVRDLGSANGTLLDGIEIPAKVDVPAAPGSLLVIGPMRFEIKFEPASHHKRHRNSNSTTTHDILPPLIPPLGEDDGDTKDYLPAQQRKQAADADEPDSAQLDFIERDTDSPAAIVQKGEPPTPQGEVLYDDSTGSSEDDESDVVDLDPAERESSASAVEPSPPPVSTPSAVKPPTKPTPPAAKTPPPPAKPAAKPKTPAAKPAAPRPPDDDEDADLFDFFRRTNL